MLAMDNVTQTVRATIRRLVTEQCNPETSFGKYADIFTSPKYNFPYKEAYCVVPNKYYLPNGTIVTDNDLYIYNEYASIPGNFLYTQFRYCKNNTATGKVCASTEQIENYLNGLGIGIYMIDNYVDLNNLEAPATPFLFNYMQGLMRGFTKMTYFKFQKYFY